MLADTILYKKKIGDNYYVVEEVRPGGGKRKRLAIRRFYKDAPQTQDALPPKATSSRSTSETGWGDVRFSLTPEKDIASQQAESLAEMERADQMRVLRDAMASGQLPAHTVEELVNAIINFQTKSEFVKKYKADKRREIYPGFP